MRVYLLSCLTLVFALAVTGCSEDTSDSGTTPSEAGMGDPVLVEYLQTQFGLRMTGFDQNAEFVVDEHGDAVLESEFTFEVNGLGARKMYLEEVLPAAEEGGGIILGVEDIESGDMRYFDYNPTENYVLFSYDTEAPDAPDGYYERGAAVRANEDGTYTVWYFDESVTGERVDEERVDEVTVANGYEALRIVEQYNEFSTISPHIMLTAVAVGHTETPEARIPIDCNDTAPGPPVCSLFKEFCDCVACATIAKGGQDCGLCPELSP